MKFIPPHFKRNIQFADMCTGYGVAEAVRHYYNLWGGKLEGKTCGSARLGQCGCRCRVFIFRKWE
jgi:hypothetical protein